MNSTGSTPTRTSLFESVRNGYYRNTNSDEIPLDKLLEKASGIVRDATVSNVNDNSQPPFSLEKLLLSDALFFSSSYSTGPSQSRTTKPQTSTFHPHTTERGFSNWILPGKIMVGQYPGRVPEKNTPTQTEVDAHLKRVLDASVAANSNSNSNTKTAKVCFVSLQSELPPQDDYDSWKKNSGEIYLADKEWPNPFSHYAPVVKSILAKDKKGKNKNKVAVQYLHHSIRDLSVPSNSSHLRLLLWKLLDIIGNSDGDSNSNSMVYIHCWGGRGRAGLTACCLLTLLNFASASTSTGTTTDHQQQLQTIFDIVQTGYDSRLGSQHMPLALSKSPQTDSQRAFVAKFYEEVRAAAAEEQEQS